MSDHANFEELAGLYPLGGLDPEDQGIIEQHLASGCASCEAALVESLRLSGRLLDAVSPIPPPAHVKERLMEQVRSTSVTPPQTRASGAVPWRWLAAAASLGVVAVGLGMYSQSLRQEVDSLRVAVEAEDARRRAAMARTAELESRVATLTGPSAKAVSLTGQGETAGARAQAFLDLEGRVLLYVYDLPPLPPGQTYQLWVIVEGTPISAGTFDVASDGTASYDAEPIPTLGADQSVVIAVTAEPAGGVPQPTGPLVLIES